MIKINLFYKYICDGNILLRTFQSLLSVQILGGHAKVINNLKICYNNNNNNKLMFNRQVYT